MKKIKEWLSLQLNKNPGRAVILIILFFNIVLLLASSLVISTLSIRGTENMSFWEAAYHTVTMVLDAGCIGDVVADVGEAGVGLVLFCLCVVVIGMITFTGAVIGYLSNYISNFIENANDGSHRLNISDHIVIINWNSRASEVINDLLYTGKKEKVVVIVSDRKNEILRELNERLSETVAQENRALREHLVQLPYSKRRAYYRKNKLKRSRLSVIVREGDTFSVKQLNDVSLKLAKSVLILGSDVNNTLCRYEYVTRVETHEKGNPQTVKALVLVADITADSSSADDQKIIVEVDDDWTMSLVSKIIQRKEKKGKCNIIPVRVNKVLGGILSQFSLMPELNLAYGELFSNKGITLYAEEGKIGEGSDPVKYYLASHASSIPLTTMEQDGSQWSYYSAEDEKDIRKSQHVSPTGYQVSLNRDYWIERKNVVILGHNSKVRDIMQGFDSFRGEWNYTDGSGEILQVVVIDDAASLERMNYYREYPYVVNVVEAEIYDRDVICSTIEKFVDANPEDTSLLILSDDMVLNEDIDASAIANLVYVQEIISRKKAEDPAFDEGKIDVIVEIIDPKHYDVVRSYSVNNVIISNRYISKMIMQLGEKAPLYNFYADILTYDEKDAQSYTSNEIYVKKVSRLFNAVPEPCTAYELIRAVYDASLDPSLPKEKRNPSIVLGYIRPGEPMVLFGGDQRDIQVSLSEKDKLVILSNH